MSEKIKQIYIVGTNSEAKELAQFCQSNGVEVLGFINDRSTDTEFCKTSIVSSKDLLRDVVIVNCSTSVAPVDTQAYFSQISEKVIYFTDFIRDLGGDTPPLFKTFAKLVPKFSFLRDILSDDVSRQQFASVVNFRSSGELRYMQDFQVNIQSQYLDMITKIRPKSLIDVGGFDGDTTQLCLDHVPSLNTVHLFEPNTTNYEQARKRLKGYSGITYHKCGLGRYDHITKMSSSGSSSSIDTYGDIEIKIRALDTLDVKKVDLIKVDIEGEEQNFLLGAQNYIRTHLPALAVAGYHKDDDFYTLTNYIFSEISDQYNVYFRHYTQGWSESILYFIPKGNQLK